MKRTLLPLLIVIGLLGATSAAVLAVAGGGDGAPVRSDEGIAPDECSLVHNIDACDQAGQPPVRSDEGIDPDECNLVHNIDACSPEELEEGGLATPAGGAQPPITSH